jgi:basic membrane protein A
MSVIEIECDNLIRRRLLIAQVISLAFLGIMVLFLGLQLNPVKADVIHVGLVTDVAGLNDNAFNWSSYQGLLRAESELGVVGTVYTSTTSADYETNLNQCAMDGNDLCISVGFLTSDAIMNAAQTYSNTKFAIVDEIFEYYPSNLRGMSFASNEVGYLAGTLAGLMTESDVIGDIGGMEIPQVTGFTEGYQRGAECINPQVTTIISYTNDFGNPELGAIIAQGMISEGADVIFAAAGQTTSGAIITAAQSSVWAIGVDTDYYETVFNDGLVEGAEYLLSSAMKKLDNAVFLTISDVVNANFTSGTKLYDLTMDGVGLAPFHESEPSVPQSVKNTLDRVRQDIIDGKIDVNVPCPGPSVYLPIVLNNPNE